MNRAIFSQDYDTEKYFASYSITALCHDQKGYLWAGSDKGIVYQIAGNSIDQYQIPGELLINHLLATTKFGLIISTSEGLYRISSNEITSLLNEPFLLQHVNKTVEFEGGLLCATEKGIWQISRPDERPSLFNSHTVQSRYDHMIIIGNKVFASTSSTLYELEASGIIREYKAKDSITALSVNHKKELITGIKEMGPFVLENGYLKKYLIPEFSDDWMINDIFSSAEFLLFSTEAGLKVWDREDYSLLNFYLTHDVESPSVNAATMDYWGNLWAATGKGLIKYKSKTFTNQNPPLINITKVIVPSIPESAHLLAGNQIKLSPKNAFIKIEMGAIDLSSSKPVSFQWRLKEDQAWSSLSTIGEVSFSNLAPGSYSFQARATTGGKYYGYSEPLQIRVIKNFLSGVWPVVFVIMFIILIAWIASYTTLMKKEKRISRESAKLILENKLLKAERKLMQLQMNPHFIFNALNSIQGLIAMNNPTLAKNYLNSFSKLMRSVLEHSRYDSISVNEEVAYLENYLRLEQLNRDHMFEYEIDDDIEDRELKIPSMLIQPFLENAIKHGLKNRSGNLHLKLTENTDYIQAIIQDDGVGRHVKDNADHNSLGIKLVRERIIKYSKLKNIETVGYEDLKDANGKATGTRVFVTIPIVGL